VANQKTITITLDKRDNEAIKAFIAHIEATLGVKLSHAKAARAMLHRAVAIELDSGRSLTD